MKLDKTTSFVFAALFSVTFSVMFSIAGAFPAFAADDVLPQPRPLPVYATTAKAAGPDSERAAAEQAKTTITQMMAAVKSRNAERAFSLAGPALRDRYATPARFLSRLHYDYYQIYDHIGMRFLETRAAGGDLVQTVELNSLFDPPVTVIYRLRRGESGAWLVDSFAVLDEADSDPI